MIKHLTHPEIDKAWWDAALLRCTNRLWYAQSWILDIASPGWEALVDEETGAIMPLTWRRKWGVNYLFQPYGLQQLGLFAPIGSKDRTDEFLAAIPSRFRYWDICLNESMRSLMKDGVSVTERTDQVLSVNASIEELREAYSKGHRRNIRSSDHGEIGERATAAEFFELFSRTTGSRYGAKHPSDLVALQRVVEEGIQRDQCRIVSINDGSAILGAVCFATWEGRSILLKSANTPAGLEAKAIFRIIDHWIASHAGSDTLLDFAGSMTPSVERFNAGFGARPRVYLRLVRNRLPAPLRWLKR